MITEPKDAFEYLEMLREQQGKESFDFRDIGGYLEEKARRMNIPLFGQFELTPLCNLNCGMCYVHLTEHQMQGRSLLTAAEWMSLMQDAFSAGMYEAALTGGECLTYPAFDEIYLFLQSLGCHVTVMTNGILLDEERIRFFMDHPPSLIQLTLYGADEETYERVTGRRVFHQVLNHIHMAREAGFDLLISITPTPALGEDVFETLRLARSLSEYVTINTSLFVSPGEDRHMEDIEKLDDAFYARIFRFDRELRGRQIREFPEDELPEPGGPCSEGCESGLVCGGGRSGFVIDWKGGMRACNRFEAVGFPLQDGFEKAWEAVNKMANSWPRFSGCTGCFYEEVCHQCAAWCRDIAEPGKQPKSICKRTRFMVSQGADSPPACYPFI